MSQPAHCPRRRRRRRRPFPCRRRRPLHPPADGTSADGGRWDSAGQRLHRGRKLLLPLRSAAGGGWEGGCELLDIVDHILPEEGQHWVSPTFICTILSGEPRILEPAKYSEIGWFHPEKVPADLTQITRENLAHYLRWREGQG